MRLVVGLVGNYDKTPVSARQLAKNQDVPYDLACKLLQKLASAELVKSSMGASGGFELAKAPDKISLYEIVKAVQGGICLNRCVPDPKSCPNSCSCGISKKLIDLQDYIDEYLKKIMLSNL